MSRKRFGKNVLFQYGFQIAKYLIPFITLPYLTRVLGSDAYGVRVYILALMNFVQVVSDYGFTQYGTKLVANETKAENRNYSRIVLDLTLAKVGLIGLSFIFVMALSLNIGILGDNRQYLLLAFLNAAMTSLLPDFLFMGLNEMAILTTRFVISKIIPTVLVFAIIQSPHDLLWVPALDCLAAATAAALTLNKLRRTYAISLVSPNARASLYYLKASTPYFISNASGIVLNSFTTLVVGYAGTAADTAYWGIALSALSIVQAAYTPLTTALFPHMLYDKDWKLFLRLTIVSTVCLCFVMTIFAVHSEGIVLILGGEQYRDAVPIICGVSPLIFLSYLNILLGVPFMGVVGLEKEMSFSAVVVAILYALGLSALAGFGGYCLTTICLLRVSAEGMLAILRIAICLRKHRDITTFFGKRAR